MKLFSILTLTLALTGCAVGPDYLRPDVDSPPAFKEAPGWKAAEPQDESPRGHWWEVYGDTDLNALASQVEISNQNVQQAAAQYRQADAGPRNLSGAGRTAFRQYCPGAAGRGRSIGLARPGLSIGPGRPAEMIRAEKSPTYI